MTGRLQQEVDRLRARVRDLEGRELTLDPAARAIAASSSDNIMLVDRDARIQYINRTVPDLTVDQVLGTPCYEFVPEEFRGGMRRCFERVLDTREPDRFETNYVAEDGDISYWESRVSPVVRADEVVGFAVISSNVTELRREQAERERFFNMSLDLLCIATLERFLRVNPAFERQLGYTEAELLDRPFLDFIHPDDVEMTVQAARRLEQGQDVIDFENRYRRKDGEYRLLSWQATWDSQRKAVYSIARDVTDKRALEDQLRHAQKMDAIGQLAGGIAHDFNNLVLAIKGNVSFAERETDPATRNAHLEDVQRAATRAAELTRQLLTFGRRQQLDRRLLDLNEMLRDVERLVRSLLPEDVEFDLALGSKVDHVLGDRSQLEQVLINLCVNARDAMPDGGRMKITNDTVVIDGTVARTDLAAGRYARLALSDNGVGMAPEIRDHVFEPFFTTKEVGHGTGLGLATAYGIVQQHDGAILVESERGVGTTFEIYLPASSERAAEAIESARSGTRPVVVGGPEIILVAEDEDIVRRVTVKLLERAGYTVLSAADGAEALQLFRENAGSIGLVLLDVVMPRMGGHQAWVEMRRIRDDVAILFTSGYADARTGQSAADGAIPVVRKPYEPDTLLRQIREALDVSRD